MTTTQPGPFALLLRHHRVRSGLSQEALAERATLSARAISVFRRGLTQLCQHLVRGRLWTRLWLLPELWPTPHPSLSIYSHDLPP